MVHPYKILRILNSQEEQAETLFALSGRAVNFHGKKISCRSANVFFAQASWHTTVKWKMCK